MTIYIDKYHNFSYDYISEDIPLIFNKIVSHLVTDEDEIEDHEVFIFKDVMTRTFSIECSCHDFSHFYSEKATCELEDDDKESILKFIDDLKTDDLKSLILEEKQRFWEKNSNIEESNNPSIFYLEF